MRRLEEGAPVTTRLRASSGRCDTAYCRGAQSDPSGTPSLSSSGSTQSLRPSPSVSGKPSSVTKLQLSSLQSPLQVVHPSPSRSNPSSITPLQLLSTPSQSSVAPGKIVGLASLQSVSLL